MSASYQSPRLDPAARITGTVLFVDDRGAHTRAILTALEAIVDVRKAASISDAHRALAEDLPWRAFVVARMLPDGNGSELETDIHARYPGVPVFLITDRPASRPPSKNGSSPQDAQAEIEARAICELVRNARP